jgi:insulin-like growth factor 2 mRNA-binding protein 1
MQAPDQEMLQVFIPAKAIGAMIGKRNWHIKHSLRLARAYIKITLLEAQESKVQKVIITRLPYPQFMSQGRISGKLERRTFFVQGRK